jgi:hypothetical protein
VDSTSPDGRFRPTGLLIDLDGTLIDRESRISVRVAKAVRLAAQHVPVAIASGREPDDVAHFARLLGLTYPQIADNGARIVDPVTGRTLHERPIPRQDSQRVVRRLEGGGLRYYAVDDGKVARAWAEFTAWSVTVIAAHAVTRDTCDRLVSDLSNDAVQAVPSTDAAGDYWYANFTRAGISKAYGARCFAGLTGASTSGIVAVGDSHNDLPMFAEAGLSVAMGHARDEIKSAANEIVGALSEDGLAEAVERFVLRPLGAL